MKFEKIEAKVEVYQPGKSKLPHGLRRYCATISRSRGTPFQKLTEAVGFTHALMSITEAMKPGQSLDRLQLVWIGD